MSQNELSIEVLRELEELNTLFRWGVLQTVRDSQNPAPSPEVSFTYLSLSEISQIVEETLKQLQGAYASGADSELAEARYTDLHQLFQTSYESLLGLFTPLREAARELFLTADKARLMGGDAYYASLYMGKRAVEELFARAATITKEEEVALGLELLNQLEIFQELFFQEPDAPLELKSELDQRLLEFSAALTLYESELY